MKLRSNSFAGVMCVITILASSSAASERLTVFAAASLKEALDDVIDGYEDRHKLDVTVSYASSSTLARQIEFGAPADVFISANDAWMDRLEEADKTVGDSRINLLGNSLVLIGSATTPEPVALVSREAFETALGQGRLAVALVDAVPAGIYSKAALEHFGLWQALSDRVAQTDNVRAALALVAVGAASLGIVYATDAQADPRVTIKATFPPESHPDINYPAAVVRTGHLALAKGFLDYLQSPEADDVFDTYGFQRPSE